MAYFESKFSENIIERFAEPIEYLQDEGFLNLNGKEIVLTREGLLQVDRLLHEFFLKEHKNARYA